MRFKSIRVSLTCAIAGVLVLLMIVSIASVAGLITANRHLDAINRKWLTGTQLLGDLKNTVAEFRVVEGYRTLAADPSSEVLAARDATVIDDLVTRYAGLARESGRTDDLTAFQEAWGAYLKQHRSWIGAASGGLVDRAVGDGSVLQRRYEVVQLAVDAMISDVRAAADAEVAAADRSAQSILQLVTALAVMAALLTTGLIALVDLHVTKPLGAITTALTRLAGGHRDTQVPELHRSDEIGAMATAFEVFRANAVALAEAQERAEALARHDALTGLANRRLFAIELEAALRVCLESDAVGAMLLIDLDRFKPVNDLHGHPAGDMVLCEIATRLRNLVGTVGTVARLGGDEFAVILPPAVDRRAAVDAAIHLASRIVAISAEPVTLGHMPVVVGASIGISLCPADGQTAEDVLRTADMAMYRAKRDGRGTFRFFEESMDEELRSKVELETDVRLALSRNEIRPYYQPLVNLSSDRIAGFEVLSRWDHPTRGFVPPDTFIPIVEQLGLLDQLTTSVLTQAFKDARHWDPRIPVAVNISPAQFQDTGFAARLAAMLLAEEFHPERLEIEVTETALIGDLKAAKTTLEALQELGVRVVLDDFGTGYSSLSHLREFHFDKIKIDRSFIRSMHDSQDSQTIVDAVLGLARNLGLPAVAEGIEDAEIRHRLASRGCDYGQGYWFSKAVPADLATAMLAEQAAGVEIRSVG